MKDIKLSVKDWKAFAKIIDEAETKACPKLEQLIRDYLLKND